MLSPFDEFLHHQTPRTVRHAGTSDHRFYDRYWFEGVSDDGGAMFIVGVGLYLNTGMWDGYLSVQRDCRQSNVRVARPIGDDLSAVVGPLTVQVVEPFKHLRITLAEGDHPVSAHLDWRSRLAPHLETPTIRADDHRVVTDISRYGQLGTFEGWVDIGAERISVDNWWSARDHSWGVRPGVGGYDLPIGAQAASSLHLWTYTSAGDTVVHFQQIEDGDGNVIYLDGSVESLSAGSRVEVVSVEHEITFFHQTREWESLTYVVTAADGRVLRLEAEALQRGWAYRGTGYGHGFNDRRGLGAPRPTTVEWDVLDLSKPGHVTREGDDYRPGHREHAARVSIAGQTGMGHLAVVAGGAIPRYGIGTRSA